MVPTFVSSNLADRPSPTLDRQLWKEARLSPNPPQGGEPLSKSASRTILSWIKTAITHQRAFLLSPIPIISSPAHIEDAMAWRLWARKKMQA